MIIRAFARRSSGLSLRNYCASSQTLRPPPVRSYLYGQHAPRSLPQGGLLSGRIAHQRRWESTATPPRASTDREEPKEQLSEAQEDDVAARKAREPAYEMTFTCRQCLHRSSHRITKQAYHFGTTLITCPGCKNRHLISDNLKIFSDQSITIEDILREKGEFLRKGRFGEDGDIEFYDEKNNDIGKMLAEQGARKEAGD